MAFGKDPSQMGNIAGFRGQAQNYEKTRARNAGGGGSKPTWLDAFKPSTTEPDEIRILRGVYEVEVGLQDGSIQTQVLPYMPYTEHFHGGLRKGSVCSAGPLAAFKDKRDPCRGCDIFWAEKSANRGNKKGGAMSKRDMYSFSILHYAPYALVEQVGTDMQVRTDNEGKPYMNWTRILPHEVHSPKFQGRERRDAQVLHWDIGYGHWNTLLEYDKEIGKSCVSCGGRDSIKCEAWVCQHCGEALIEMDSTTHTTKEIEDLTSGDVRCAHCQEVGRLNEIISCTSCGSARRADIFDVDMRVKRVADPKGGNQTTLMIPGWSNPRGIDQRFADFAKPMDLKKIFTPTPMEKQEELYGAGSSPSAPTGGRQPVTVGQHSRTFGK